MFEAAPVLALTLMPLIALAMSVLMVPLVRVIAQRMNFVDRPGGRKQHDGAVAYGGGVAIFLTFGIMSFFVATPFEDSWAYFLSLAMILITGIIDDKRGVNAKLKFAIHFLSAFILVIAGHTQLVTLGNLLGFGNMGLGWAVIPFSVACVVYIINAINMMDGVDGLGGGICLIVFLWLLAAAVFAGQWSAVLSLSLIIASLIGFLIYNMRHPFRKKASIFLGDAGSMALGLTIAWYAIHLSQFPTAAIPPVSVAWIIALPIIDAFGLLVMRIYEGRPAFEADRRHFHHHFLDSGYTPGQTTCLVLLWAAILGGVGFVGLKAGIPEPVLGWAWVVLWLGHALLVTKPEIFRKILAAIRS